MFGKNFQSNQMVDKLRVCMPLIASNTDSNTESANKQYEVTNSDGLSI